MMSTATTVTNPSAAIIAKITNVEFVSIGSKYFTKYIILIGKFERNALLMGFLYITLSFFWRFGDRYHSHLVTKKGGKN